MGLAGQPCPDAHRGLGNWLDAKARVVWRASVGSGGVWVHQRRNGRRRTPKNSSKARPTTGGLGDIEKVPETATAKCSNGYMVLVGSDVRTELGEQSSVQITDPHHGYAYQKQPSSEEKRRIVSFSRPTSRLS